MKKATVSLVLSAMLMCGTAAMAQATSASPVANKAKTEAKAPEVKKAKKAQAKKADTKKADAKKAEASQKKG
jgi:hypothetical protein